MFKHIGAEENKALIELTIHDLSINISVPNCSIIVLFQRGDRKSQTAPTKLINKQATINQVLRVPTTLFYDIKKKEYQQKTAQLVVLVKYEKGLKQAGIIDLDLSTYLNQRVAHKQEKMILQKCPDANAYLSFTLNFLSQNEQRSKTPEANINAIREFQQKDIIEKLKLENEKLKSKLQEESTPTALPDDDMKLRVLELERQVIAYEKEIKDLKYKNVDQIQRKQVTQSFNENQLIEENNRLKEQIKELKQRNGSDQKSELLYEANTSLKESLFEIEQAMSKLKKDNQDLKTKIQIQNQQLVDSRERIVELENELEQISNDERVAKYQEMIDNLTKENLQLKNQYSMQNDESQFLQKEKQEYEEALDQLSKKYDQLEQQLFIQKEKYAKVMHEFLCKGDSQAIEILEKYSQ